MSVFVFLTITSTVLSLIDWVSPGDLRGWIRDTPIQWPLAGIAIVVVVVLLVSGAGWLVASFIAGFEGPEPDPGAEE